MNSYNVNIISTPTDWISLGISLISVVASLVAVYISVKTLRSQRKHDMNSVRPIINIRIGDFNNGIYVKLYNQGIGPATIDKLVCTYKGGITPDIIEDNTLINVLMSSQLPTRDIINYTNFVEPIEGWTISPGDFIDLVELQKNSNNFDMDLFKLRLVLKDVTLDVNYSDIYENKYECSRKLDFFGRSFNKQSDLSE